MAFFKLLYLFIYYILLLSDEYKEDIHHL